MTELHRGRSSVYSIQYHIVIVTKHRKPVLDDQTRREIIDYIEKRSKQLGVTILEANGEVDHIHLLVDATPTTEIPTLMKAIKGTSAHFTLKNHPEIAQQLWGGHLWSPSYFIATDSENTEERILDYILHQGETTPDQQHRWEATLRRTKAHATKKRANQHG